MTDSSKINPIEEFRAAIQNPLTRKNYEERLAIFLRAIGRSDESLEQKASSFVDMARKDPSWATLQINSFMNQQKERALRNEISQSTLPNYFKPIKLFCIENDITLNWKKISRRIPHGRKFANDRIPTMDEIRKILSYPDRRIMPAVLIMLSSGGRVGMFDHLSYGDISPIVEKGEVIAAKIRIYAGCEEEYFSFLTPQAYYAVEEYVSFRKEHGENVTADSPVLRDLFKPDHLGRGIVNRPLRFGSDLVRHLVSDALKASGIRKKLESGKRRYEFQPDHGFRKFFNTVCDKHMKTLYVEFLLGHDTGLKESYNRAQESELSKEYLKAVPELTISVGGGAKNSGSVGTTLAASSNETSEALNRRIGTLEQGYLALTVAQSGVSKMLEEILNLLKKEYHH